MERWSWDEERLAAFLAGPVTWAPLVGLVFIVVGVTVAHMDVSIEPRGSAELAAADPGAPEGPLLDGGQVESFGADDAEAGDGGTGDGGALGSSVFAANCASCHGASGEGGVGPPLAGRTIDRTLILDRVGSGQGVMPGFAAILSAEEIDAVVDHVLGLGAGTVDELAAGDPGSDGTDAEGEGSTGGTGGSVSGSSVFAANCAACHGASGQGGIGPPLAGQSIGGATVRSRVNSGRGAMPSFSGQLSAAEIDAVVGYVVGLGSRAAPATGAGGGTDGTTGGDTGAGGGAPASGSSVFAANCAACHGASGQGGIGPPLAGRSIDRTTVSSRVNSGRGAMPSFSGRLSADEIDAVVGYVIGLGSGGAPATGAGGGTGGGGTTPDTTPGGTGGTSGGGGGGSASGGSVFAANCAACHGASGQGGIGPQLAGRSIARATIASRIDSGGGAMPSFAGRLSADEVSAVIDYVLGLGSGAVSGPAPAPSPTPSAPQTGGSGPAPFATFCSGCHGADGRGTSQGRDLRGREDKVFETVRFGKDEMPAFPESAISDAQLGEIIAFVRSIKEND